jgi:RNA polymerase sigma-70 factor, ECF subfamily
MLFTTLSSPHTQYPDPDWILISRVANGDKMALQELHLRFGSLLLAFLNMKVNDYALAEDLLQEVLLSVWLHANQFQGRSSVKTWLLVIARNTAINSLRKKRPPVIELTDMLNAVSEDTSPGEALDRQYMKERVRKAIRQLPEIQREVLTLTFYHQLSGQEIADVLEISLGTVKSRLFRAKETLKGLLGGEEF